VAIAFRTPSYKSQQVEQPVQVYIQLRRPSDGATSEPLHFQLLPLGLGRPGQLWSLRKTFARKKAVCELAASLGRGAASEEAQPRPRFLENLGHLDGNGLEHADSPDEPLGPVVDLRSLRGRPEPESSSATPENDATLVPGRAAEEPSPGRAPEDWFDYTEVGRWVERSQRSTTNDVDHEALEKDLPSDKENGDKSLGELLNEVVELDRIYEDTHVRLLLEKRQQRHQELLAEEGLPLPGNGELPESEADVRDNQTYTSLQMAMRNPVWVRARRLGQKETELALSGTVLPSPIIAVTGEAAPPRPPPLASRAKRDGNLESEDRLPPLPPKRIRKTPSMPALGQDLGERRRSGLAVPHKNLPMPPNGGDSLPKQQKPGLFSKLFFRKGKRDDREETSGFSSTTSLPGLVKTGSDQVAAKLPSLGVATVSTKSLELQRNATPPYEMDLTEAEHYALYTDMAPHATVSEFDEMSFYYSPVEGGKILLEDKETAT
jgi:c-Rel proto-oncogene protein